MKSPLVDEDGLAGEVDVKFGSLKPVSPFGASTCRFLLYSKSTGECIPDTGLLSKHGDPPRNLPLRVEPQRAILDAGNMD